MLLVYPLPVPMLLLYVLFAYQLFAALRAVLSNAASKHARRMCTVAYSPPWISLNAEKIAKFGESAYKLFCHGLFSCFAFAYLRHQDWYKTTALIWARQDQWVPVDCLHVYYLL